MKNLAKIKLLKNSLNQIISKDLSNLEIFEKSLIVCNNRYYTNLDPLDSLFRIFILMESDLDEYPTSLPENNSDSNYLENCKNEISKYIEVNKKDIIFISEKLLEKLNEI